ncbi:MAG: hypothetical protein JWM31_1648 [Solirubrobacterales bacterium]|nr:hypothetical protein [Solirubrobacterales bacterium]
MRVDKITPARTVQFAEVQAAIKQQLAQTKPQESAEKWQEKVEKKWKAKTECKKRYDTATFCKNAPTTTTTATTGS